MVDRVKTSRTKQRLSKTPVGTPKHPSRVSQSDVANELAKRVSCSESRGANSHGKTSSHHDPIFYSLAQHQIDTPADSRGYAVLLAMRVSIIDPTMPDHRLGYFVCGPDYLHRLIQRVASALAYLPEADGSVDDEVAGQIALALEFDLPIYRIDGRELVAETLPARLAA